MCLFVYLVTDADLPELPWDKKQPAFCVERLKRKEKFLRGLSACNDPHPGRKVSPRGKSPPPDRWATSFRLEDRVIE